MKPPEIRFGILSANVLAILEIMEEAGEIHFPSLADRGEAAALVVSNIAGKVYARGPYAPNYEREIRTVYNAIFSN